MNKTMKKKTIIISLSVGAIILLGLYGLTFVDSRGQKAVINCLAYQPKCIKENATEEEILKNINDAGLSKKRAKKIFLDAQDENQGYYERFYKDSPSISSEEKEKLRMESEALVIYYKRALKAIETMED
jgi:hypothetical protein